MKLNHFVNKEMFSLMNLLQEKQISYRVYVNESKWGNFGIEIGDFDANWFIDITEYLSAVTDPNVEFAAIGLSILMQFNGKEDYQDVSTADAAMEIITEFYSSIKLYKILELPL